LKKKVIFVSSADLRKNATHAIDFKPYRKMHVFDEKSCQIQAVAEANLTIFEYSMMLVSWVLAPCGFVDRCQRFGETCCLHLQG
jgi:hypothetical protein